MNKKRLILILVLVAILTGIIIATIIMMKSPAKKETNQDELIQVSNISHRELVSIDISNVDNAMRIMRQGDVWINVGSNVEVDNITCELIATNLCYVFSDSIVETTLDSLETYCLDEPVLTAVLTLEDGSKISYIFGRETADKTAVYFMKSGDNNVYTMLNENFAQIKNDINTIMDLSLPFIYKENIAAVSYKLGKTEETIIPSSNYQSGYMFEKTGIAASEEFITLIKSLPDKKLYASIANDDENSYGFENGDYINLVDSSGNSINISLGNKTEDKKYYCMIEGKEGIYLASDEITGFMEYETSRWMDKRLLPVEKDQILKISIASDNFELVLENSGDEYLINGISAEQAQYDEYFDKLIQVKGTCYDEEKNGNSVYTMVVSLKNADDINIRISEYLNEFYSLDYGKGNHLFIQADSIDSLAEIN